MRCPSIIIHSEKNHKVKESNFPQHACPQILKNNAPTLKSEQKAHLSPAVDFSNLSLLFPLKAASSHFKLSLVFKVPLMLRMSVTVLSSHVRRLTDATVLLTRFEL